jgi:monomeric isocitrate dehydrogenase
MEVSDVFRICALVSSLIRTTVRLSVSRPDSVAFLQVFICHPARRLATDAKSDAAA